MLIKYQFSGQLFEKFWNINFHKNLSNGSRVFPRGRTDRHENLKVTFRNFANAFKKSFYASVSARSCFLFSQSAYREKLKENQSCKCRCQEVPLRTVTIGTTVTLRRKIELFHWSRSFSPTSGSGLAKRLNLWNKIGHIRITKCCCTFA